MIKKRLAKVSVFMMAAAMAASVAACTPENKNGGQKTEIEIPAQTNVSKETTKKGKANKPEKKKKKEAKTKAEIPASSEKSETGQTSKPAS